MQLKVGSIKKTEKENGKGETMTPLYIQFMLILVKCLTFLCDIISLPIYFLFQMPWKTWISRRTVWAKRLNSRDPYSPFVRVSNKEAKKLNMETASDIFRRSVSIYGPKKCIGTREVLDEVDNNKGQKKLKLGDYKWLTYNQVDQQVEAVSRGLRNLGMKPRQPLCIFAETRSEWFLASQSCFRINVPIVTLYPTLGEEGLIHGLLETEVDTIVTSASLLPKLKNIPSRIPHIKTIIYMGTTSKENFVGNVRLIPFSKLLETDTSSKSENITPLPEDLAVIMYTSGSTGVPKGVMMTHANIIATTRGYLDSIQAAPGDMYIGYLPLAHVLELSAETLCLALGIPVGYSSPVTLTDISPGLQKGTKGDMMVLRPTLLASVPLMLERIQKMILATAGKDGSFSKGLFQFAVDYKIFWTKLGFQTTLLNRIIFNKYKALLGGRIRMILCGGAPLSPDTQCFLKACLNTNVIQGYGLTETCGSATVAKENDDRNGIVGHPLSGSYIKLVDWDEGGYHVIDKPNPRGEVVIGGDNVSKGYFKNNTLTKEIYTYENGIRWLYSGDIGEILPDGSLKIIDRKKDLVKLQMGEYVALGKVEAQLKTCPLVDNICIYGSGFHTYLVALITPNSYQLHQLAKNLDKQSLNFSELCTDKEVAAAVLDIVVKHAAKGGLEKAEIPRRVKLCTEEWLPDTGLVTAAFKLRRKELQKYYQHAIAEMYASSDLNGKKL